MLKIKYELIAITVQLITVLFLLILMTQGQVSERGSFVSDVAVRRVFRNGKIPANITELVFQIEIF